MAIGFSLGVVAFVAYVAVILVLLRIWTSRAGAVVVLAAAALHPSSLAVALLLCFDVAFWTFSATYWCLALLFLMAFGAIYKSISLRILLDLLECPGRSENYDSILNRYVAEESFGHRLGVIQASGFARLEEDGYRLTPKGLRLAKSVRFAQTIFSIERSG
jgi:hypothetical protein